MMTMLLLLLLLMMIQDVLETQQKIGTAVIEQEMILQHTV